MYEKKRSAPKLFPYTVYCTSDTIKDITRPKCADHLEYIENIHEETY